MVKEQAPAPCQNGSKRAWMARAVIRDAAHGTAEKHDKNAGREASRMRSCESHLAEICGPIGAGCAQTQSRQPKAEEVRLFHV